jgi:hypothetical protein
MTLEILKTIQFMLNHGFYTNLKELREVATPMISLMNGANDKYFDSSKMKEGDLELDSVKRYFSSGTNDIIVECKCLICDNLRIISNLEFDGKALIFLSKFKNDLDMLILKK